MKRIRKYQLAGNILYPGLNTLDRSNNWMDVMAQQAMPVPQISSVQFPPQSWMSPIQKALANNYILNLGVTSKNKGISSIPATSSTDDIQDNNLGNALGNIFSQGVSSIGNTAFNNVMKGHFLTEGMALNAASSIAGATAGLAGNLIGQGINSLGDNSMLSRGIGQGIATGIGTIGGQALSNIVNGKAAFGGISDSIKAIKGIKNASNISKAAGISNLAGIGGQIVGAGLLAAFGPSKEYGGKYGGITLGMDTAYDLVQSTVGFIPGWGLVASGAMALNKGLSNIFGSTSGMTKQDAILGSAFMPAPVKWLNMAGAKTTQNFGNQSWQNTERTNAFMQNAFGNLSERFDRARQEAGKTYGTFSQGARRSADRNLAFANDAWEQILAMADLDELQRIRSLYMTSINNLRYAQMILGGWNPIYRGKQGMKIFNNATNHNMGMRLLSAAALIDNKQMILSALNGTKMNGYISAIKRTANYNPYETIFTFPENINIIKTDAKKSKDWINWWLMNREGVLALNMKSTKEEAKKERWRQVARINPNSVQIKNTKDVKGGNIGAYTNPNTKLITFKPFVPVYKGLITHEQTHSMGDSKYLNAQTKKIQELLPKFTYTHPNDKKPNNYWNDPIEIYGRLMQFRRDNKINPKHKFTLDEIKSWYFENAGNLYSNGKMNDSSNMLLFYSPETMQMLLNEVAQNPIQFNNNFNNMG